MLEKLKANKRAEAFLLPVDTKELGLEDYHEIVKNPMDLGTVTTKLKENKYTSPVQFAGMYLLCVCVCVCVSVCVCVHVCV